MLALFSSLDKASVLSVRALNRYRVRYRLDVIRGPIPSEQDGKAHTITIKAASPEVAVRRAGKLLISRWGAGNVRVWSIPKLLQSANGTKSKSAGEAEKSAKTKRDEVKARG